MKKYNKYNVYAVRKDSKDKLEFIIDKEDDKGLTKEELTSLLLDKNDWQEEWLDGYEVVYTVEDYEIKDV